MQSRGSLDKLEIDIRSMTRSRESTSATGRRQVDNYIPFPGLCKVAFSYFVLLMGVGLMFLGTRRHTLSKGSGVTYDKTDFKQRSRLVHRCRNILFDVPLT